MWPPPVKIFVLTMAARWTFPEVDSSFGSPSRASDDTYRSQTSRHKLVEVLHESWNFPKKVHNLKSFLLICIDVTSLDHKSSWHSVCNPSRTSSTSNLNWAERSEIWTAFISFSTSGRISGLFYVLIFRSPLSFVRLASLPVSVFWRGLAISMTNEAQCLEGSCSRIYLRVVTGRQTLYQYTTSPFAERCKSCAAAGRARLRGDRRLRGFFFCRLFVKA